MRYRHPLVSFERAAVVGIFLLCVLSFALGLSACTLNPDNERRDRLGVQATTMALIERADSPAAKAEAVRESVAKARTLLDMADVSVADIRVALLARVAERDLSPLEKLAALEVINAVSDGVELRLGAGQLSPEERVSVNTVLDWVEGAAALYVPK
jgi:hypothetical protein